MKVHILDDWFNTLSSLSCFQKLAGHDVTVWTEAAPDEATLVNRLQQAEAVVLFRERTAVTRSLVSQLPHLKLISQRGVYPHVDVPACTEHNVLFCSKLGGGPPNYAAAELTFALILSAMRQLPTLMTAAKAGQWQVPVGASGVGKTLRGRTLGLYGFGRIAKLVAGYAQAFGMTVVWWGSEEGRARAVDEGQRVAASREAFFGQSDVVSLHVRLTPETTGLITTEDLAAMQPDSVFVNTSRAKLVQPGAMLEALQAGRPGLVALDVFETEPLTNPDDPVLSHPQVIATPHIGFVTEDEFNTQFSDIFDQVNAYAAGSPIHMINPEVWGEAD